ncbi:MAG: alpha/beta hydrolase [Henriciella sp.]|nr:alpha/beta hydrolase [Henriciella sp.]
MSQIMFLHGVPDTPAMWGPVIEALGLADKDYRAPAMPGFGCPVPAGFDCTKEAYVDWYIREIEAAAAEHGPVDMVGHDWGAIITIRAASLRPDLVRTWTVANALPHPDYQWHTMARRWQTPIIGELVMALAPAAALKKGLADQGLPTDLAAEEAAHWNGTMKGAILKLYRSAKTAGTDWYDEIDKLPERGLIFWGVDDPYVPVEIAEKFAADTSAALSKQTQTGHWSIVERAPELAEALKAHWA